MLIWLVEYYILIVLIIFYLFGNCYVILFNYENIIKENNNYIMKNIKI